MEMVGAAAGSDAEGDANAVPPARVPVNTMPPVRSMDVTA
jgi:hypothetical protein